MRCFNKYLSICIIIFFLSVPFLFIGQITSTHGSSSDWADISQVLKGGYATTLLIAPDEPNSLYVGITGKGIYKTSDNGQSWMLFNKGLDSENSKQIRVLKFDPTNQNIMYLGTKAGLTTKDNHWVVSDALYKSNDRGITWSLCNKGIIPNSKYFASPPDVLDIEVNYKNNSIVYIATQQGVYKSIDRGANWKWSSSGIESVSVRSIAIDPINPLILYATSYEGIYISENEGISWKLLGLQGQSLQIVTVNPQNTKNIYVGGSDGVFKSTDGGKIWVNTGLISKYDIVPSVCDIEIPKGRPSTLYVASNIGIFKSDNYGNSWIELDTKKIILFWSSNDLVLSSKYTIYSGGNGFKDKSGGLVWMWQDEYSTGGKIEIIMKIGTKIISVNNQSQEIDVPPVIVEGRTLLPIRYVVEPLGGSITWDAGEKKVTINFKSTVLELWIGNNHGKVNGVSKPIDLANLNVVPMLVEGRTMLPVRFVAENIGCEVLWDGVTKIVTIIYLTP